MNSERSKLRVPLEPLDVIIEIINISILVFLITYTFTTYQNLPEIIPTHFNAKGEVDGFGSKNTIWFLPGIGVVLYVAFSILNRFPHIHKYKVNITKDNALKNYRFSKRILRFTLLFVLILFLFMVHATVSYVKDKCDVLGSWFLPTILVISFALPLFIFFYNKKMNKS